MGFFFFIYIETDYCLTPDSLPGQCIFLRSCSVLSALFQKRTLSQNDRQYLSASQCGFQDNKPLVCCKAENDVPRPIFKTQLNSQQTERQSHSKQSSTGLLPKPGVCGFDASDRIFGGERTKIDEYPWMARLQYTKRKTILSSYSDTFQLNFI